MTDKERLDTIQKRLRKDSVDGDLAWLFKRLMRAESSIGMARHEFTCKANLTDPQQDCCWPHCDCDPYAQKVLAALSEEDSPLLTALKFKEASRLWDACRASYESEITALKAALSKVAPC